MSFKRLSFVVNPAAANEAPIAKEGFLTKQGGFVKSWKKRWFVLQQNKLTYYDSEKKKENMGVIDLEHTQIMANNTMGRGRENCIEITADGKRTYFLVAATAEDLESWMNALLKASVWMPDQDVAFLSANSQARPTTLEEIKIQLLIKGMIDGCCQQEVRQLLSTLDKQIVSDLDAEKEVITLTGRFDTRRVVQTFEDAGYFLYEL